MNNLLSIDSVSKHYGDFTALNKVSINIKEGSIFGLLGPNGAGKTTLIRIINQITHPDEGKILFNNEPLNIKHIRDIGYLPEERGLYPKMNIGDQAVYLAQLKGLERETAKSEKQSNNQEEISSEEKTNDAEESPDIKDVSEGETLEEKTNDADTNEVNDKKNKEVDKDLELNENKSDDSNETETKQNQEEEKKVSNEEKDDDNLKSEEPKEK